MARTQGTNARVQRLTTLVAIMLVGIASAVAFGRVYVGATPTLQLVAVGLVAATVAWAFERRGLLLATAVSGGLLLCALAWLIVPETTWYGVPTLETVRQIADVATQVGAEARHRVSPTDAVDPLLFAAVTGVWAAAFSCHALAFRAGSPLLGLVPPVALVAFADTVLEDQIRPRYGLLFLVAALAIVFADGLRRVQGWGPVWSAERSRGRFSPAGGRNARRLAVAAVAIAAVSPAFIPGFGAQAVFDVSSLNKDERVDVSLLVSLGARLTSDDPIEVFEVRSSSPSYWRMTALERFDGVTWQRAEEAAVPIAPGAPLAEPVDGRAVAAEFSVQTLLDFTELPVPYAPSGVAIDADLSWSPSSQTLTLDRPLQRGDTYRAEATSASPTVEELAATAPDDVGPALVALPGGMPPQIADLAREWTADASTPYEQVLAIQQRLTDRTRFSYSTDVSYRDDVQTLVEFLTVTRRGFCQQYASAMAVMLRSLGIPARVAVGFTAGARDGSGGDRYQVTTRNLHAWVEVPFEGYGWLAFEPTPGRANPGSASYLPVAANTDPSEDVVCPRRNPQNPDCVAPDGSTFTPPPASTGEPRTDTGADAAAGSRAGPLMAALALAGLIGVAAVAIPSFRALRRRARLRRAAADPRTLILATYDVFAQRAGELGLSKGGGETPEEYRRRVESSGRLRDGHLDRLTAVVMRAAYAPDDPNRDEALDATTDADEILRDLRRTTPLRERVRGRYRRG
jgi:transglutaminase-like putative cysteine protease